MSMININKTFYTIYEKLNHAGNEINCMSSDKEGKNNM